MSELHKFPIDLTESNVRNLVAGRPIQLKNDQLKGSKHFLIVHPTTHRRMTVAKSKGKGLRLTLTQPELVQSGEGFKEFWNKVKSVGNWVKSNIIDSPLYQSAVKPVVKELVSAATTAATPMLGPLAGPASAAVQKVGEITNAYGLPAKQNVVVVKKVSVAKPKAKPKAKKSKSVEPSGSFFVN